MKPLFNAALLAVGLALSGVDVAAADIPSFATDSNTVIQHYSTAHNIGNPCGVSPCPPKPRQGR